MARRPEDENLTEAQMRKQITEIDRSRAKYYAFFSEQKWGARENYDLLVNTSGADIKKFKDVDKIADYAKTAMQWASGSGLVKGKSGDLLDPQGTATRAEIAAMLHRFLEKYELVQGKAPGGLMG